jgi:hypothetical protein
VTSSSHRALAVTSEDVEDDVGDGDSVMAVEDVVREAWEARPPIVAMRDELAVKDEAFGQAGELWKTFGHVPAPATAVAEPVDGRNERLKSVPFHLERVAGPKGEVGRTSQHRIGQPQVHPLPRLLRRSRLAAVGRG